MAYRDKRPVDELSIEELEHILAIRRREEREKKLHRMKRAGRIVEPPAQPAAVVETEPEFSQLPPALIALTQPAIAAQPLAQAVFPPPQPTLPQTPTPEFEDESYTGGSAEKSRFWRSFVNQVLLLVEGAAVIGLLFLGYQMLTATSKLQQETANAQAQAAEQIKATIPTLVPTPQIQLSAVVLPGGHKITASGEIQFNYDEVPEALRYLVTEQVLQPITARPQPTSETAVALNIPRLNIDQVVVQGTDWEALKLGIGQFINGVNPGDDQGNLVLSGHNDVYGEIFKDLDQIKVGDEMFVRTATQVFTYRVVSTDIVRPNDVSVMSARGGATITLISCYPYKVNDKRYIVYGERVS
jgi:sortase A